MKTVLALALCVATCSAHMCLLEPKQRGSFTSQDLNNPGANACILTTGPCGGKPMEEPTSVFKTGTNQTIIFQKNLDHFDSSSPGYFSLTLTNAGGYSKSLFTTPDSTTKSLTLYTATVSLVGVPKDSYVLEAQYVTKNPQAPAVFYQCADIAVV